MQSHNVINRIGGVMVSVLASSAEDRGFGNWHSISHIQIYVREIYKFSIMQIFVFFLFITDVHTSQLWIMEWMESV
jgi:hypothetical protein